MKTVSFVCTAIAGLAIGAASAEPTKFLRYPAIANDGRLAFSYHGDIWTADADGANPRRLTAHVASDTFARFSPDGDRIAFVSNRMGNNDLYVVDARGGEPQQITFNTTNDNLLYWTPDGNGLLFSTSRGANPWGTPLHIAALDGSEPQPLNMDMGASGMISQDGETVAFNRRGMRYWRKGYKGNSSTEVWVMPLRGDGEDIEQLTDTDIKDYRDHVQDAHPMWGSDGSIYFMSERDGIFNIWSIDADGDNLRQVTFHDGDGVQYPSISPDGSSIVYESEFEIWRLDLPGSEPRRIEIDMSFDPKDNLMSVEESENEADGFAASPDGKHVAVDFKGELFIVPADKDLGEKIRVTDSEWRDRYAAFSPTGEKLAYISDSSREEEIWVYDLASREHTKITDHESTKQEMAWSPDGDRILWEADKTLFVTDIDSQRTTELIENEEGGFNGFQFAADGDHVIYSRSDENLNSEVYLYDIEAEREHNLTQSLFNEFGGELTPDGTHAVFASNRTGEWQIYAVSLAALTENPNDPVVKGRKAAEKPKKKDDEDADEAGEADDAPEMTIDLEGIEDRAMAITEGNGRIRGFMLSPKGDRLYYQRSDGDNWRGPTTLYSVKLDGTDQKEIAKGGFGNLTMTEDGKTFFFSRGGNVHHMKASGGKPEMVEFDLRVHVDHEGMWEQMFEEAWRVMKYRFYDPDMHGVDWAAMRNKYRPLLSHVGENQDLYDLTNEMIGELNASHTGVSGPASRSMERLYTTQHLGFQVQPDGDYYRVTHVHEDGPADHEWLDIEPGNVIVAINGKDVRAGDNIAMHLNDPLNDFVTVTVADASRSRRARPRNERDLRIETVSSMRNIMYNEWVEQRRAMVDEWSDNKVGYVHIRSMNQTSLAKFETEIDQFWNKNGMIIDIR
ncbi:MAG: DPP IV N-terminal domain-containing protein [Planctomycetota bacterium]